MIKKHKKMLFTMLADYGQHLRGIINKKELLSIREKLMVVIILLKLVILFGISGLMGNVEVIMEDGMAVLCVLIMLK